MITKEENEKRACIRVRAGCEEHRYSTTKYCHAHFREYMNAWNKTLAGKASRKRKDFKLRHKGFTLEEAQALLEAQGGLCAICGQEPQRPMLDHNHKTEQRRGILCSNCNVLLGMANEDPEVLLSAIEYLESWADA